VFAPPVAKPKAKTAAVSKNTSPRQSATPVGHSHNDGDAGYVRMLPHTIGNQAASGFCGRAGRASPVPFSRNSKSVPSMIRWSMRRTASRTK
jgi:hypothetical protein